MFKTKTITLILIFLCMFSLIGCSKTEEEDTADTLQTYEEEDTEVEEIEEFTNETVDADHEYLSKVEVNNGDIKLNIYSPTQDDAEDGTNPVKTSLDGVTVNNRIFAGTSLTSLLNDEKESIQKSLKKDENISDIEWGDLCSTESSSLISVSYIRLVEKEDVIEQYACMKVIKTETINESYSLRTIITIDTTKATDDTQSVLDEIEEVYGISLS